MEEYSFNENRVRIKAQHSVSLPVGRQTVIEHFNDCNILHRFTVVAEDSQMEDRGFFYVWYQIEDYQREIDALAPIKAATKSCEDAILELAGLIGG